MEPEARPEAATQEEVAEVSSATGPSVAATAAPPKVVKHSSMAAQADSLEAAMVQRKVDSAVEVPVDWVHPAVEVGTPAVEQQGTGRATRTTAAVEVPTMEEPTR